MTSSRNRSVLAIFASIVLGFSLAACSTLAESTPVESTPVESTPVESTPAESTPAESDSSLPAGYTQAIKDNFVKSCSAQQGATTAFCETCFDKISAAFSGDEFIELDKAAIAGTLSKEQTEKLNKVISECAQ